MKTRAVFLLNMPFSVSRVISNFNKKCQKVSRTEKAAGVSRFRVDEPRKCGKSEQLPGI